MKLIKGVKIGNVNDGFTGVTVITFEDGCVCGCDVRGGAPGTRETALLASDKANEHVDAIALCGGSAYGLIAACGAMNALKEQGKGVRVMDKIVPIVPSAVIYDLNDAEYHFPTEDMGYRAVIMATDEFNGGRIGVGKGATVGKILGIKNCSLSGVGIAVAKADDAEVIAIMAVNAFGDVRKNGKIIAGAKCGEEFVDTLELLNHEVPNVAGANTTIGCVITDAKLTKVQANKLASVSHNGLAQTIFPVHTDLDGDTIFCASVGDKSVDMIKLQVACVNAVKNAIWNAVTL